MTYLFMASEPYIDVLIEDFESEDQITGFLKDLESQDDLFERHVGKKIVIEESQAVIRYTFDGWFVPSFEATRYLTKLYSSMRLLGWK